MLVGASVNSDFCLPGGRDSTETVDSTILRILDAEGYNTTSFEFKVGRLVDKDILFAFLLVVFSSLLVVMLGCEILY